MEKMENLQNKQILLGGKLTDIVSIDGKWYEYNTLVSYMDDEIREDLHLKLAPCSSQKFIDEYLKIDKDFMKRFKQTFYPLEIDTEDIYTINNYQQDKTEKYNEILKLRKMLQDNNIHHYFSNEFNGYSILIDELDFSVIEHDGSYGSKDDKLEIMGLLTEEEKKQNKEVLGFLTAENVFIRIVKGLKQIEKLISLDNGLIFLTARECMEELRKLDETEFENKWESIVNMMEFDICQQVEDEISPCTEEEFLKRYLQLSKYNLILG